MYSLHDLEAYNQKHINNTRVWIEFFLLRLCWLLTLALVTISDTNIFGVVAGDEAEANLPWDTYHFLGLRGGLKLSFLKAIFHQSLTEWRLEELEGFIHPQLYVALINLTYCHPFLFLRRKNKIYLDKSIGDSTSSRCRGQRPWKPFWLEGLHLSIFLMF